MPKATMLCFLKQNKKHLSTQFINAQKNKLSALNECEGRNFINGKIVTDS